MSGQTKIKYPIDSDGFAQCVDINKKDILDSMNIYNIVVIDVLNKEECEITVNEIWEEMNEHGNGKLDKNDPITWQTENWPEPEYAYLSKHYALTQQSLKNMVNPRIALTFEILFGHSQICPKVGVPAIKRPVIVNGQYIKEWELSPLKLHYDKDNAEPYHKYPPRYQGCLALVDCSYDVGSFACSIGSANEVRKNPNLWLNADQGKYVLKGKESGYLYANCQKIPLRAGSMVIWDRSVAHYNFTNQSDKPRIVHFFSYSENTQIGHQLSDHTILNYCKEHPEFLKRLKQYNWNEKERKLFCID